MEYFVSGMGIKEIKKMPTFKNKEIIPGALCTRDTGRAILAELEDGSAFWVPQSQIDDDSEVYAEGDEGDLIVSSWFHRRIDRTSGSGAL